MERKRRQDRVKTTGEREREERYDYDCPSMSDIECHSTTSEVQQISNHCPQDLASHVQFTCETRWSSQVAGEGYEGYGVGEQKATVSQREGKGGIVSGMNHLPIGIR
jgi:hypothetical protein